MKLPRLTLRRMMIGIAAIALPLALVAQGGDFTLLVIVIAVALTWAIARWVLRLSFRTRLILEISAVLTLLAWSGFLWRPAYMLDRADKAEALAEELAWDVRDARPTELVEMFHEIARLRRLARDLRIQAWWRGLAGWSTAAGSGEDPDVEYLGYFERLERRRRQVGRASTRTHVHIVPPPGAHERRRPRPPWEVLLKPR